MFVHTALLRTVPVEECSVHNLLRCRRGSAAFATVVALVPLIGAIALGGEAGSWYVTKQHAQNAADAAAYSGALLLACTLAGSSSCNDTETVDYRGKEFAAQNGFCNAGDTTSYPGRQCATSLGAETSQAVTIATLTVWNGVNGNFVQATVQQTQPVYLAAVLGLSTVNIGAQAIAEVNSLPTPPCVLALSGPIGFQGNPQINAPNCGLASNDPATNALDFTGGVNTFQVGSLSAVGGCSPASDPHCANALTYKSPVTDPFSALDGALTTLCGANPSLPATCGLSNCNNAGTVLVPYTAATKCTNNGFTITGNKTDPLAAGVYFISGTLKMTGTTSITGTGVTLILLPGATIDTKGGGTLTIAGPTTAPSTSSLPTALQTDASLFQYMAVYDASATAVQFGGNSNINITGNIYAPTAAVTFQGNPTISLGNGTSCGELIAASVAFNGHAGLDSSGCTTAEKPNSQYVQLVQ
jgi:Flp pilus assembly protein TadG